MPRKTVLITGCDRRYFPLLEDFVTSVTDGGGLARVDLGIFDLDFDPQQLAWLSKHGARIVPARSPIAAKLPYNDGGRRTLPSLVRPFFPDLFPGYDVYVYSDVDVWVQDWTGFERFIDGAQRRGLAICAQQHPAYTHKDKSLFYRFQLYSQMFGDDAARGLMKKPHINAGIFAMTRDAPHWQRWGKLWGDALRPGETWFGTGQAVLTHMIFNEGMTAELLPAICNWQSHLAMPLWDEAQRMFVEPHEPHDVILLMHMTDDTKWLKQSYRTLQGNAIEGAELRYGFYKRLRDGEIKPQPAAMNAAQQPT
jgi:hypothetical protein